MAFIRSNTIQAALVAYLKGKTALTSALKDGAEEIRENTWKGTEFTYPNVRVDLTSNKPNPDCPQPIGITFQVYSEYPTSYEADNIAGIIVDILHGSQFQQSGLKFGMDVINTIPAISNGVNLWRSDVIVLGQVS